MVLRESPYVGGQVISDNYLENDEFELSCDEYAEIFNELMRPMKATHYFEVLPKVFKTPYI